jgi:hypothetical protein
VPAPPPFTPIELTPAEAAAGRDRRDTLLDPFMAADPPAPAGGSSD